jgi:putative transposase
VLREAKILAHRGPQRPPRHERPKELIANEPNQVWGWDITYLKTSVLGQFYFLYLVMDIYSRKIVGWEVAERESEQISTRMISKTCMKEGVSPGELFLHADNGGPMKASTMLGTLQKLGVIPSFSRPKVSDDNAYSESLFKTLKYRPFYPQRPFANLAEASAWVEGFVDWYNNEHMHSGINYVTPASRHNGDDERILDFRKQVFAKARMKNPERWTRGIRSFDSVPSVVLNARMQNEGRATA